MSHLSDIRPGQVIGRYEFLTPIAQGGMAAVWAARQRGSRGFSKVVALKTMLPAISDDPRFEKMFLDEARVASHIRHSNVVQILDLGEENNILYLVMEWVDGESLSALRRMAAQRDGIPLRIAVRIIADVCAGLHAAHELVNDEGQPLGLVHRDVSPQNILVGYDGDVKILDFGVAKVAGRSADTTNVGHARGKPPYMAPEQALGKETDRRADVFALGIILYQLLVGRHPFRGENDIATLHNIISDQPVVPPRQAGVTISSAVEATVLRALERDPARRFQTAREFELALETLLDTELGRVRADDVAQLMAHSFGAAREDRRSAIREAIRRADSEDSSAANPAISSTGSEPRSSEAAATSSPGSAPAPNANTPTTVVQPFIPFADGEERALETVRSTALRRWLKVILTMGMGATLAWLGSTMLLRGRSVAVRANDSDSDQPNLALSVSGAPTVGTVTQIQLTSSGGGASSGSTSTGSNTPIDLAEKRKTTLPRRGATLGNRSVPGTSVSRQSGLPPIPSPGF